MTSRNAWRGTAAGIALMLALVGCGETAQRGGATAVGGVHPQGWQRNHARSASEDLQSCALCHAEQERGGRVTFECNACHIGGPPFVIHPARPEPSLPWRHPVNHGSAAKAHIDACQGCHGQAGGPGDNPRFTVALGRLEAGCESAEGCHGNDNAPFGAFENGHNPGAGHPAMDPADPAKQDPRPWYGQVISYRAGDGSERAYLVSHFNAGNLREACPLCHGAALEGVDSPEAVGRRPGCRECHTAADPTEEPRNCVSCHDQAPVLAPSVEGPAALARIRGSHLQHLGLAYAGLDAVRNLTEESCRNCHARTTREGAPVVLDVLRNDADADGDPLTVRVVVPPRNGTVEVNPDGTVAYSPNPGFAGRDTFSYVVSDGQAESAPAAVGVEVLPSNDPPRATDDRFTAPADAPLEVAAPGVLGNDGDPDGDPLSVTVTATVGHGALELAADGSFRYTPDPGFLGTDSFAYALSDGVESRRAVVTLQVGPDNAAPVGAPDRYEVDEDGLLRVAAPGVLANDADPDGDSIWAELVSGPKAGTLTFSSDGSFRYEPTRNASGPDGFAYRIADGVAVSAPVEVAVAVRPVPDAPVANRDRAFTSEDTPVTVAVLRNDGDADGDPLTVGEVTAPLHGAVEVNRDGTITYTPAPDFFGEDAFTYRAADGTGRSEPARVTVAVAAAPDLPSARGDAYTAEAGAPLEVPAPGVLGNDRNPDGDPLTALLLEQPVRGTLILAPDGSFVYEPSAGFAGTDAFTYAARNGAGQSAPAVVTVRVRPEDRAPVAVADTYAAEEDRPLEVPADQGVLGNDTDPDGDTLTAIPVDGPSHGALVLEADGAFTYEPEAEFHGEDRFTYFVQAGGLSSGIAEVSVAVAPTNDRPVAEDDSADTEGTHHQKVFQPVPEGSVRPYPEGDAFGRYSCLSCHRQEEDEETGTLRFVPFRDCRGCHRLDTLIPSTLDEDSRRILEKELAPSP